MADVNTKEIDFGRVAQLMGVVEKQSSCAPGMVYLTSAAMTELRKINDAIEEASRVGQEVPPQAPLTDADPTEPRPDPDLQGKLELPHEHRKLEDYRQSASIGNQKPNGDDLRRR